MAARQKTVSYVDGPRVMTDEEQKIIFNEVDYDHVWAICKGKDSQGNQFVGYVNWPRNKEPYGTDKGNCKANMAFIRAERQMLDRACPGALPADVETVDEAYVPNGRGIEVEPEQIEAPEVVDHAQLMLRKQLTDLLTNDLGKTIPQALEWLGRPTTGELTVDELNFAILCAEEEKSKTKQAELPF